MNHADRSASVRARIARLSRIADTASDQEVREALREVARELENELAFIDRKYG
jgi:hypothetical protein